MATRTLRVWGFRPQTHIIDTITWTEGTTTVAYSTGTFRDHFVSTTARAGHDVAKAFDVLTGWSNGYIGIYPPGEEPWTDNTT